MNIKIIRDDLEKEEEKQLKVEDGADIKDVLEKIDVEPQEVLVSREDTILTEKHEVEEEDELKVMDVIAGG